MINQTKSIKELLSKYNNFEECIIEDIKFSKLLTDIEITFNFVWDEYHQVRKNLEEKKIICLKISLVEAFKLENRLPETEGFLDRLNWGYNEIAIIKVNEGNNFTELNILWESERRIIILFSGPINIESQ